MHILITGATGFIGRHFVYHLLQQQIKVTILVRELYSGEKPLPEPLNSLRPQFNAVYADLRNYRLTARAVQEAAATHVVHLAAAGVTAPFIPVETTLRHNLNATINLLRACFENKNGRSTPEQIIVARTPGERTAMNVYAAGKAAAWQFCRMYARTAGWPIHGGMIFQAYGPDQNETNLVPAAIRAAQANQDFPMTTGTQKRDWIYLDDIVTGLKAALGKRLSPGTSFELGTGCTTSVAEVVQSIYRLAGSSGRPQIGVLPSRPGEEGVQIADAAKTRQLIGWQAETSLEQGLRRLLAS
ncbi:MAG: NAD(P)-dependent oxidoreductase [Candidatus Promineifilaceae bacterium]